MTKASFFYKIRNVMDFYHLKSMAKQQIRGNIGILFVIALIVMLVSAIPVLGTIAGPGLSLSLIMVYLNLIHGQRPVIGDSFEGLNMLGKAWWLNILISFFTMLWSVLLVIPGIIKMYSYSMALYILAEHPTMTAREALDESKRITDGHKMELFMLDLSFIGWFLLGTITFGIAFIYVTPYLNATRANFYNELRGPVNRQPA